MKRFLSIVLIAAALFGIYNYYLNITDVLACKTYWEDKSSEDEDTLNALGAALNKLKKNKKTYTSGQKQLAKGEKSLAASEGKYYKAGSQLSSTKNQISEGTATVKELTDLIKLISTTRTTYSKKWKTPFDKIHKERTLVVKSLKGHAPNGKSTRTLLKGFAPYIENAEQNAAYVDALTDRLNNDDQKVTGYKTFATDCNTVAGSIDEIEKLLLARETIVKLNTEQLKTALNDPSLDIYNGAYLMLRLSLYYTKDEAKALVDEAKNGDEVALQEIIDCANDEYTKDKVTSRLNSIHWVQDYITANMKTCAKDINANANNLFKTQDTIATNIRKIANTILNDSTLKKYAKKALGAKAISVLEYYAKNPSPLSTSKSNFLLFETQMDTKPGLSKSLETTQKYLTTQKTAASKKLSTAKSKYKSGLKTYKATPAKLNTARKKLDNIKKKLAQFESSEKELEKGLSAFANTEANGDLKSIKDRLGGDVKFTDKKGHFDVNKGQAAVDAGEAYLNERGDLIKKELTGRIIATVMGVISAVLALLAALLSLFRSNRGAAIIACISAVMAAGAAVIGSETSSVYSELAGSHIGNAPWMAAAIIAGVAMVFSVTHFSAKIEDPLVGEE